MTSSDWAGEPRMRQLLDELEIRDVLYRYCRGIDRRDYALVRECYHDDATDDHAMYVGGVDGFIEYVQQTLPRFDRTMHFLGNIIIEVDGRTARSEAYAVAYHRLPASRTKPLRDWVLGLRYVDDFEERDGRWRIAARVCALEWSRLDPVPEGGFHFLEHYTVGLPGPNDVVFADSLASLTMAKIIEDG